MSEDQQRPRRGLPPDAPSPAEASDPATGRADRSSAPAPDAPTGGPADDSSPPPADQPSVLDLADSWFRAESRRPGDPANGSHTPGREASAASSDAPDPDLTPARGIHLGRHTAAGAWAAHTSPSETTPPAEPDAPAIPTIPSDVEADAEVAQGEAIVEEQAEERPVDVAALIAATDAADLPTPDTTWLAPEHAVPVEDDGRRSLRASILLTLASLVLPGSGLLGARRTWLKVLGGTVALLMIVVAIVGGWYALNNQVALAKFAASSSGLTFLSFALAAFAVVWVGLIATTHIVTRPAGTRGGRKILGAVVVTALAFTASAPSAVGARYARDAYLLVNQVLPDASDVKATNRPTLATQEADPWAGIERVNVLLLGADGDASRADRIDDYGIRTDTIMVASIDTATGDTTLIQIPRNVQYTPFPEGSEMASVFPDGFRGTPESDFWVNGIWETVEKQYPDLLGDATYPGAEGLKQGVEGITGLKMDYFVMLNIDGLKELIDAMGGVTVNINQELAIGGSHEPYREPSGYLTPGPNQKLGGYKAMWYARSRFNTDDYNRMARQSCLVDAIIAQANPQTLLTSFEPIAAASADLLTTDIPQQDLSAFIDLAFRVKDATVSRLVFTNGKNGYSYANPDFDAMQAAVKKAITPKKTSSGEPSTSSSATATKSKTATATKTATSNGGGAETVADACAYTGDAE